MTYFDMAPNINRTHENYPEFKLERAKASTLIFELYFKARGIDNSQARIDFLFNHCDQDTYEWLLKHEKQPIDTWTKFKIRLNKYIKYNK